MLHLVSEQFDPPVERMEYEHWGAEWMAQLEREDLEQYHRSILRTSNYCDPMDEERSSTVDDDVDTDQERFNEVLLQFRDETKSEMAEMKAQMSLIISLLQGPCKQQEANISDPDEAANEVDENHCAGLGEMDDQDIAYKVFPEMPEPILTDLLDMEVSKANYYLQDDMPTLAPVHSEEDLYGNKDSLSPNSYIIETDSSDNWSSWVSGLLLNLSKVISQDLSSEDDILRVSSTNSPSLSKLGFNPQVFDPGTLSLSKQEEYESELHCVSSELFLAYSQEFGESRIYNHLSIGICCCLIECARSRNGLIDWALCMWNSKEILSWKCSALLWICNIARADNLLTNSDISPQTHAVWSIRPFADFHVGALAQMCTSFDQVTTMLPNGHYMVLKHSDFYFTDVGLLSQRLPFVFFGKSILDLAIVEHPLCNNNNFGCQNAALQKVMHQNTLLSEGLKPTQILARQRNTNELLIVGFNFSNLTLVDSGGDRKYAMSYSSVGEVVPPLFGKAHNTSVTAITGVISSLKHVQSDDAYGDWASFSKTLFEEAKSKSFRKLLCCCILPLRRLTNVLDLVTSFGLWIGLLSPLKAEFAWDPGIRAISVHILEDKDVFKRVGNRILVMVMIRSIRDGQIKIHVIRIEEGFGSITTWRNGTICASTNFIFPGNLVLDRHSELPQLLDKTGPPPTGLRPPFTLFSSVEDYYIDSMLRDALDDAPKADKLPINGLGESYSTQNRGLRIDQWLFDEMAESFPIKLKSCVGPNKDLRLSVATHLLQFNIKFWFDIISVATPEDVISMFGFYPGTGANEDQRNAYKGHVNMHCIVAVPFGIIDHLVLFPGGCLFRPFDPGGCLFPQFYCDPFESNVPTKGFKMKLQKSLKHHLQKGLVCIFR